MRGSRRRSGPTAAPRASRGQPATWHASAVTLAAQGLALQPSDTALSSVELECETPGSGLQVTTRNIDGLTADEYAALTTRSGSPQAGDVLSALYVAFGRIARGEITRLITGRQPALALLR